MPATAALAFNAGFPSLIRIEGHNLEASRRWTGSVTGVAEDRRYDLVALPQLAVQLVVSAHHRCVVKGAC
jgi:hypothetical protein